MLIGYNNKFIENLLIYIPNSVGYTEITQKNFFSFFLYKESINNILFVYIFILTVSYVFAESWSSKNMN